MSKYLKKFIILIIYQKSLIFGIREHGSNLILSFYLITPINRQTIN